MLTKRDVDVFFRNREIMTRPWPDPLITAEELRDLYLAMFDPYQHTSKGREKQVKRLIAEGVIDRDAYATAADMEKVVAAVAFEDRMRRRGETPPDIGAKIKAGLPADERYWEWLLDMADRRWAAWMLDRSFNVEGTLNWTELVQEFTGSRDKIRLVHEEPHAMARWRRRDPTQFYCRYATGVGELHHGLKKGFLTREDVLSEHWLGCDGWLAKPEYQATLEKTLREVESQIRLYAPESYRRESERMYQDQLAQDRGFANAAELDEAYRRSDERRRANQEQEGRDFVAKRLKP